MVKRLKRLAPPPPRTPTAKAVARRHLQRNYRSALHDYRKLRETHPRMAEMAYQQAHKWSLKLHELRYNRYTP